MRLPYVLCSSNPAYAGHVAWNRRTYAKFHRVSNGHAVARQKTRRSKANANPEDDWIVLEDQHAALVRPDVWRQAQVETRARIRHVSAFVPALSRHRAPGIRARDGGGA